MLQNSPLVTPLIVGLVLAVLLGMLARRLRLPPLLGYVLAGIVVGVPALGLGSSPALAAELVGLALVLAMFGVGLQFSLKELMAIRLPAMIGAVLQLALATALGLGLATLLGWDWNAGVLFGLALSAGSSVLLLQTLRDRRLAQSEGGVIAIGWVMAQTLVLVLALLLVPVLASVSGTAAGLVHDPFVSFVERITGTPIGLWGALVLTLVKIAAFIGFMLAVGQRVVPWALRVSGAMGSRELFRLAVLAIALALALGAAALFSAPLALGAFLAGMMLAETGPSRHATRGTLPLREAFAAPLFLALGMLFDPALLLGQLFPLVALLLIVIVAKGAIGLAVLVLFRQPIATALPMAASLAQIGEFSLVAAGMGVALAILPSDAYGLIVAGVVLSILLNPLVFWAAGRLQPQLEARAPEAGPRVEPGVAAAVPTEPKLAPVDNLLHKAATSAAVVAPAAPVVAAEALAAPEHADVPTEPAASEIAAAVADEISEGGPVAQPAAPETPPEPGADEAAAVADEISEGGPVVPPAEPGDTAAPVPADAAAVADEIAEGGPVVPPAEPEPEPGPVPEDAAAVADEISEGGPVTPPAEPEPEDKPGAASAPPVVPEPKS